MKIRNYFILFAVTVLICGCEVQSVSLQEYQVGFSIYDINFGGDWTHYKAINVNKMNMKINVENSNNTPVKLDLKLLYDEKNKPYVEGLDSSAKYILDSTGTFKDATKLDISTDFNIAKTIDNEEEQIIKNVKDSQTINNCHYKALTLNYNNYSESVLGLNIKTRQDNWCIVPDGLNYNVNWEFVHKAVDDDNLNFIVMAEGYRADQMDDYKKYVADAFEKSANFHYTDKNTDKENKHVENSLFARYWDNINVIRLDTVSPHEGIDENWYEDKVQSILNVNKDNMVGKAGDFTRITHIMNMTKPNGLKYDDVDAYIILVNDSSIWAFSYTYGMEIGWRYGQPIHPVIIQAPAGYDFDEIKEDFNKNGEPIICYFHDYVKTDAIAHELGHAIAKLQDEYEDEDKKDRLYCDWFRNVDDDTNYKWKKLIEKGYDGGNEDNHRIGNYNGGLYRKGIYRPTFNGTMRHEDEENEDDEDDEESTLMPQFGPVNTYHMVASFKIRMGKELIADQHCFDDGVGYEWQHYSIDDFYEEWPPSDFDIKQSDDKEVK